MQLIICDSHLLFSQALASLLSKRGHQVLACLVTPQDAVGLPEAEIVDAWLTDIRFPDLPGTSGIRRLRTLTPTTPIVLLTAEEDHGILRQALDDGADGAALKREGIDEVERLLRRIVDLPPQHRYAGTGPVKSFSHCAKPVGQRAPEVAERQLLTEREQEVLDRLARGQSTAAVATSMGVSVSTVRTHLQHLYVKLDVHSRLALVALAVRSGLIRHDAVAEEPPAPAAPPGVPVRTGGIWVRTRSPAHDTLVPVVSLASSRTDRRLLPRTT